MRDACMALRNSKLLVSDGAGMLLAVLRGYFAPDAMRAAHQAVSKFSLFRKSTQTMDESSTNFDFL